MDVKTKIENVLERISNSAASSGRKADDVSLVAVTKYVDSELMLEAAEFGIKDFGENRVQELTRKKPLMPVDIDWHMIGRLQKNKVKYLIGNIKLLHSLCEIEVAKEIERLASREDAVIDCLIQLNIAKEDSKSGVYEEDLDAFIESLYQLKSVKIRGFMTMTPLGASENECAKIYSKTNEIFMRYQNELKLQYLSMGMSDDFDIAVREGANIVRVGSAIFR